MNRARAAERHDGVEGFDVHLTNFEGPFDLLLQLISRRELDVTEVALSQVTDEFIAHVKAGGEGWNLEKTSAFLVVASTLLDLKAARLLPGGEVTDPEDIAALEARDLLFARLLQYRAFKRAAEWLAQAISAAETTHWRPGGLEEQFRDVLPEVELNLTPDGPGPAGRRRHDAAPGARRRTGPPARLHRQPQRAGHPGRRTGSAATGPPPSARSSPAATGSPPWSGSSPSSELFRAQQVSLDQLSPLGELTVRWIAGEQRAVEVTDDYGPQPELEEA